MNHTKKYEMLIENQIDLVSELDINGEIVYVNPSFCSFYEISSKEIIGRNFLEGVRKSEKEKTLKAFEKTKISPYISYLEHSVKSCGKIKYIQWINKAIIDDRKNIVSILCVGRDITENKRYENQIKYLSFHDKLTGLYNRAFFEAELKRLDTDRQLPISIIIADVNGLKLVNDAFGHYKGDELLKIYSGIFRKCCRKEDIIARWGGDEFALILPKTNPDTAEKLISRIKQCCCEEEYLEIPLSISFGIATKTMGKNNIHTKIKKAEDHMYKQKLLERKSFRSSIISFLEKTLLEKNHETEDHYLQIKEMVLKIGAKLKLSQSKMADLAILSSVHDIGKVAVPEKILNKKGRLSDKEWTILKKHSEIGHNIVESSAQFAHIAEYILYHHERWDGKGYPYGLKGKAIPLPSRIIAVVDAFNVITQGRNYKDSMSIDESLKEVQRCSGTHFDPKVVDIFTKIVEKEKSPITQNLTLSL